MSRTMTAPGAGTAAHPAPASYRRARAALATEWIKLRSLRSMLVTLVLGALACIGVASSASSANAAGWAHLSAAQRAQFHPLDVNLNFIEIGIVLFGVVGALVATNEYGTGLIRTTLAATPQRGLVLAAKTVLAGLLTFVLAVVVTFTSFFTAQAIIAADHAPHVSLGDHGVAGRLLGAVYYLTAAGLIGLFFGVLVRSAAAAIPAMFGFLLVLPVLADRIPQNVVTRHTVPYLPSNLGDDLWYSHPAVSRGAAVFGLAAWVLTLAAVAAFSLRSRDA